MQAIIYPKKTVWASSSSTNIVVTVDVANNSYSNVKKVAVNQTSANEPWDLTQDEWDSANIEFAKLDGSKIIKGITKHQSVTSHGKQKKGWFISI